MRIASSLTTVTSYSKFIAVFICILFVTGSFILGMTYQRNYDLLSLVHTNLKTQKAPSTNSEELAVIISSGSTNFRGWTLVVNNDGSGKLATNFRILQSDEPVKIFPKGTFDAKDLSSILQRIGDVSKVVPTQPCVKSTSFGTRITISYSNKTSADLSCISSSDNRDYQDLASLVNKISDQVGT